MRRAAARQVGACLLLCASGAIASPDAAPWVPLERGARVLAFGDSLTDGVGGAGENYPQRLEHRIGRAVINVGLPGETTEQGRRRLPGVLARERPSLLILCLGLNDLLRGVPAEAIRANLVAMLEAARAAKVPTLLVAVPAPGTARAHPLFAEAAALGGAHLDDRSMVAVLANPALKADLVHPNREGYRAMAEALEERLRREGTLPSR